MKLKITLLFLLACICIYSQKPSLKIKNSKSGKLVHLSKHTWITIKTFDNKKIKGSLISNNAKTLKLRNKKRDTLTISLNQIKKVKLYIFDNKKWLEPFAYMIIASGFGLVATPFIWAFDSKAKAIEGLEFTGTLLLASGVAILISELKKSYRINKKWKFIID